MRLQRKPADNKRATKLQIGERKIPRSVFTWWLGTSSGKGKMSTTTTARMVQRLSKGEVGVGNDSMEEQKKRLLFLLAW